MPKPEQSPPSLKTEIPGRDRKGEVVGDPHTSRSKTAGALKKPL